MDNPKKILIWNLALSSKTWLGAQYGDWNIFLLTSGEKTAVINLHN